MSREAILSNQRDLTSFRFGDCNIRFRTPSILKNRSIDQVFDLFCITLADWPFFPIACPKKK